MLKILPCLFSIPWGLFLGSRPSRPLMPPPRPVTEPSKPAAAPELVFGFCWSDEPAPAAG